ncbi:hypothetical protein BDF21DRAFT_399912 [Thamnidium elegans]|nr:hypothetical protein BDF21DRAFT_399912 [Thamnidium elegans]
MIISFWHEKKRTLFVSDGVFCPCFEPHNDWTEASANRINLPLGGHRDKKNSCNKASTSAALLHFEILIDMDHSSKLIVSLNLLDNLSFMRSKFPSVPNFPTSACMDAGVSPKNVVYSYLSQSLVILQVPLVQLHGLCYKECFILLQAFKLLFRKKKKTGILVSQMIKNIVINSFSALTAVNKALSTNAKCHGYTWCISSGIYSEISDY